MGLREKIFVLLVFLLAFASMVFPTIVILNSQNYEDIVSCAVFASYHNYTYIFALTPNQSVFISKYYTVDKDVPIIYIEGNKTVLPNMAALLKDSGAKHLTIVDSVNPQYWIADNMDNQQAIIVGSQYGQDALSVSSYAAVTGAPIFFIENPAQSQAAVSEISSRGYSQVIIYGPVAHQIPAEYLELLPQKRVIDTGSRYSNNLEIVKEFLKITPTRQAMFVSGYVFEKSMVDKDYPLILVGRSDYPPSLPEFIDETKITTGIIFAGDADIVDGVNKLRAEKPSIAFFVKFGEGYRGNSQALPLMIIPLPSPQLSLEVINISYNVPSKIFELRIANHGDFIAVSAGASIEGIGSAQSSQILIDGSTATTLSIPLDASRAISGNFIPQAVITIRYGEDTALMDNIDAITFTNIPTSFYNDTSEVRLTGVSYSGNEKAFLLEFEGNGWAEGTLGFNINNRPIVLRIPLSQIDGKTVVKIKYLLSSDEEKFIKGIDSSYFIRSGERSDILIKETRGQSEIESDIGGAALNLGDLEVPTVYLFLFAVAIVGGILIYKYYVGGADSFD
ncbi:MAG: cell wall-binding repeat-containing protein [Candidatus Micrarchaeota archaeon]